MSLVKSANWRNVSACTALFAFCLLCVAHIHVSIVDDGFIAHRYAANLVRGYGLVFTQGQRVEGISDLSWTLLMVIPQLAHWRPEFFAVALGSICGAAAFVVAYRIAVTQWSIAPPVAFAVMIAAALNAEFWVMAANGIESGMYTLALTASLGLVLRKRLIWAGLLLGFATTLRPESLALAPLTLGWIGFLEYLDRRSASAVWARWREYGRLLLPWAVIVLGVLAWRLSYYGEWAPNTVFAKAHPLQLADLLSGVKYLVRFTLSVFPWAVILILAFPRMWRSAAALGLVWFAFQVAVIMPNAGDWMPGFRLLNIYLPILAALSAVALTQFLARVPEHRTAVLAGFLAVCCALQLANPLWTLREGILNRHTRLEMMAHFYEPPFIRLAEILKPALKPTDIVSPEVLGIVSYMLLDSPMHDWLGLVDSHIAHHGTVYYPKFGKSEPDYSVDVVQPALFAFDSGVGNLKTFQEHTAGRFGQHYEFWQVVGQPLIVALRRDRAPDLLPVLRDARLPLLHISVDALK